MTEAWTFVHPTDEEMSSLSVDRRIAWLAGRQHGIVARFQLLALGVRRGEIDARIARGVRRPVHRGVYAVGHGRLTRQGRYLAAVLTCGHDAVLGYQSAGA